MPLLGVFATPRVKLFSINLLSFYCPINEFEDFKSFTVIPKITFRNIDLPFRFLISFPWYIRSTKMVLSLSMMRLPSYEHHLNYSMKCTCLTRSLPFFFFISYFLYILFKCINTVFATPYIWKYYSKCTNTVMATP